MVEPVQGFFRGDLELIQQPVGGPSSTTTATFSSACRKSSGKSSSACRRISWKSARATSYRSRFRISRTASLTIFSATLFDSTR